MDKKRPLDDDDVIPASPQVQISKRSRTLKVSQVENQSKTDRRVELDFDDFFNEDFDFEFKENVAELAAEHKSINDLDLTAFQRCIVEAINTDPKTQEQQLTLKHEVSEKRAQLRLKVPWNYCRIASNQLISVGDALWSDKDDAFVVSNEKGMIVTYPDTLISGTSVVGSLFCPRKALLSTKFMGIDMNSKIMTIGTIVHELLQVVLRKQLFTRDDIEATVNTMLNSASMIRMLYACEMSLEEIRKELNLFVDRIFRFVQRYIKHRVAAKDSNFEGQIDDIQDIEENIWCPSLGMKGKIDVTVRDGRGKLLPLELKTGRASFSPEHRGQLIIYQMMLNQIGTKVDSGLLLYLREGAMKEVPATRHEQRDLVMLRNELAYYLTRTLPRVDGVPKQNTQVLELPEPINNGRICEKCPYSTICCTYLEKDNTVQLAPDHPLKIIATAALAHLKPEHIDYFIHWTGVLALEEEESKKGNHLKQIWTETPEKRHKRGRALINLEISGSVIQPSGVEERYTHTFTTHSSRETMDFTLAGIEVNEYMVVSTQDRISVASGFVCDITSRFVTMALERDLSKNYRDCVFHIDKYDSQSLMTFNFTNLGVLLDDSESAEQLRRIIIETQPPSADRVLPKSILEDGAEILRALNKPQQRAVLSSLASKDYSLLKGLPGTGKTQTLVALIRLFRVLNKSILITSHTHSAVDNLLVRLVEHGVKFLRLGTQDRIKTSLVGSSEKSLTALCKTPEELQKVYNAYDVVAVTCFGAAHPLIIQRKFDVCVVDEATQVMQCSVIRPLLSAKTFVLVGDPNQLPPIVKSREAKSLGADESLFARLQVVATPKTLTYQYRMNKTINQLANQLTYGGELSCANDDIARATIRPNQQELSRHYALEKWLLKSLASHLDQSVVLVNTDNVFEKSQLFGASLKNDQSRLEAFDTLLGNEGEQMGEEPQVISSRLFINYCEAAVTFYLVNALLQAGLSGSAIGIIAPYRAQVELLKKVQQRFEAKHQQVDSYKGLEVNTVDQYQGRDKDVIIYSCTKSDNLTLTAQPVRDNEILEDKRRLTVAITRAKKKLIILSDVQSVEKYTPFRELFGKISGMSKVKLEEGRLGFSWEWIMDRLEDLLSENSDSELMSQEC